MVRYDDVIFKFGDINCSVLFFREKFDFKFVFVSCFFDCVICFFEVVDCEIFVLSLFVRGFDDCFMNLNFLCKRVGYVIFNCVEMYVLKICFKIVIDICFCVWMFICC